MEDSKAEEGRSRSSSMSDSTASGISLLGRGSTGGGSGKRESALDSLEKKRRESVNSRLKDLQESLHQKKEPEEAESSPISLPVIVRLKTRPIQPLPPTTRKLEQLTRRSTSYEQVIASALNRARPASVCDVGTINSENPFNGSSAHSVKYSNAAEKEGEDMNTSNHPRRPLPSLPDVEGESEAVLNVSMEENSFKVSEDMKQNISPSHKLKLNNPDIDLEAAELPTTTSVVSPSDEMVARWLQNQTEEIIIPQLSNNIDISDLENNVATCHDSNADFIINANATRIDDSKSLSNYQADTIKTFQPYSSRLHSYKGLQDNSDANYSNTLTGNFSTPQVDRSVANCDKTFDEISSKKKIRIVQDYNSDKLNLEAHGERSGVSSAFGNRNKQQNDKCSPTKKVQFMLENEQPLGSTAKTASHRVHFNDDEIVKNNTLDLSTNVTAYTFPNTHKFEDYTRREPKENDPMVSLTSNSNSRTDNQKQQHESSQRFGDKDSDWTNDFQQRLNVIRQRIINIDENKIQSTNDISTRHSLQTFKHDEPEQIKFSSTRPKSENFHVKTDTDSNSSNDFDSVRAKMLSLISTIPSYASKSQLSSKQTATNRKNIDKSISGDNYRDQQKFNNSEKTVSAFESVSSTKHHVDYKNEFDSTKLTCESFIKYNNIDEDDQGCSLTAESKKITAETDSNYTVSDIIVQKSRLGLGFSIEGGRNSSGEDRPIVVKRIFQSGQIGMNIDDLRPHVGQTLPTCGELRTGDEILSADGHSLSELSQYTAWNFLKSLPDGKVRLTIRREINKDGEIS